MKKKILVNLKERKYPIFIGDGLLQKTGELLRERLKNTRRVFIISDKNVFPLYGKKIIESLEKSNFKVKKALIEPGETSKNLETASHFYDCFIENRLERNSAVISLGGGVVGDLAGFAAATYMRGINFVQIPTSLLAQVDSSIGGKVAVNHPRGKNLVGDFHQPSLVITDVSTLNTLPKREFISGMAEVIKHGLGFNKDYFNYINSNRSTIMELNKAVLANLIYGSCQIKKEIVERDVKERDVRSKLNLGHTIAHALENVTEYRKYNHGEAVAIGLFYETALSARLGLGEDELTEKIKKTLQAFSLPTTMPEDIKTENIIEAINYDKKMENGKVEFSLPAGIGRVITTSDWSKEDLDLVLG